MQPSQLPIVVQSFFRVMIYMLVVSLLLDYLSFRSSLVCAPSRISGQENNKFLPPPLNVNNQRAVSTNYSIVGDTFDQTGKHLKQSLIPNLLLLGAQKGGSTAIAGWMLREKEKVCGSSCRPSGETGYCSTKEPHFFDGNFRYGLERYVQNYDHCNLEPYWLDGTPNTLPYAERVQNIYKEASKSVGRDLLKELKALIIIRDPVARELSLYNHKVDTFVRTNRTGEWYSDVFKDGKILSFDEYTDRLLLHFHNTPPELKKNRNLSLYSTFLRKWLEIIPRKSLLILRYDEFKESPEITRRRISQFLDLEFAREMREQNTHSSSRKVRLPSCKAQEKLESFFKTHNEALYELIHENQESRPDAEELVFPPFTKMDCQLA